MAEADRAIGSNADDVSPTTVHRQQTLQVIDRQPRLSKVSRVTIKY
jgi:hypothetical protein